MVCKIYAGISFFLTVVSMILTKCSPTVLFNVISDAIESFFPFVTYLNLAYMEQRNGSNLEEAVYWFLLIMLVDWVSSGISYLVDQIYEDKNIFFWLGDSFIGIFFAVLHTALTQKNMHFDIFMYWYFIILFGGALISTIYLSVKWKIDNCNIFQTYGLMFLTAIKFLWYTLLSPMARLLLPALICVLMLFPFSFITFLPIQMFVCILFILGFAFIKRFSDMLIDKIPSSEKVIIGRFIVAIVIIISEIWVITDHSLPLVDYLHF